MKTGWILAALLITCAPALSFAQDSEELRLTTMSKQLDGESKANTHVESVAKSITSARRR